MRFVLILFSLVSFISCKAQNESTNTILNNKINNQINNNPKLIVGIVVDQMRYDYLTRFYNKYGEGGFKRLMTEGFNCKNHHFNYMPTKTGPGHASIFTGTTPKYHGIIGNSWYNRELKTNINCVGDNTVYSVGTTTDSGKRSPHNMNTTTFSDENRLFTQMRGKTIGISIKDRGSILAAGHTANAAYWFHGKDEGNWITSSFYMKTLPEWVSDFNTSNASESYLKVWNTLYDISTYTESGSDNNTFEGGFRGKESVTFPYDLAALKNKNGGFDILKSVPYGNSLTTDFAIAAIDGEHLGQDDITDVLTVSFSSTDYIGHNFGVNAKETEDAYLRLDKDLERFLNALDGKVGKGEYTVFLTADHGAPYTPEYLKTVGINAGLFDFKKLKTDLDKHLGDMFGNYNLIERIGNEQVFLDYENIKTSKLDPQLIKETIINEIIKYELVDKAFDSKKIAYSGFSDGIELLLQNGYNQKRSGDIFIILKTSVFSNVIWNRTGTNHWSGFNYDTHVPLIFFGKGITHGETLKRTKVVDIAPTISALLGISFPNASIGNPLEFVLD